MGYENSNTTPETESDEIMKSSVEELVPILIATILSTKEPEYSPSMGYENSNTTPETESDEIIKSSVEELVPILSKNEDDDDISVYDDFEDIEYVEASLFDHEIVSIEEENVVHQAEDNDVEEEEVDLEDISQIQDVDLREKSLSITRLISNIESLNDNLIPDRELNSFVSIPIFEESDNSLLDNFSPEFKTFCDYTEETRSGNTTHANDSLPEYDSFCFEIEPDQERLNNLASDNSIPSGIENVANDSEGDIRFLEELLINDSILSHESSDSNFEDNPSVPRPPPKPPDAKFDARKEIQVVMNDKDEDVDYSSFIFVIYLEMFLLLLSAESEDTIFNPGPGEKKPYEGSKPLCPKCNYRHDGQCAPKCTNCKRIGHSARDCKNQLAATNNQRAQGENQRVLTCFECRAQGHFRSNFPKLKNKNLGNQARNGNAIARAYDVGTIGTNPNSNVVTGTFLLNNRYALILFHIGVDRSFISTAFSSLIDIIPTTLDYGYDVKLADGRIIWFNTLIWVVL
nr:hypothetical protein [Tanacetum cinerariifolium]